MSKAPTWRTSSARRAGRGISWPTVTGTFQADVRLQYAVQHALLIIGEAFTRLEPEHRQALTGVPVRQIIGMRNRVAHEYWAVDPVIVWQVATEDLAALLTVVEPLVVSPRAEIPSVDPDRHPLQPD